MIITDAQIFIADALDQDMRVWVPVADGISYRPLFLSVSQGYWITITRVSKPGIVSRHHHPQPVHGLTLKGSWRYQEHDWVATEGSYIYEPPGDRHTLVVDPGQTMLTMFQVHGAMIQVDEAGRTLGFEDVFTRLAQCRSHFAKSGLGADYVDQFIR